MPPLAHHALPAPCLRTPQHGGYGSIGYGYAWATAEAEKNLLRTHTTAVSSRMLYRLAQVGSWEERCKERCSVTQLSVHRLLGCQHDVRQAGRPIGQLASTACS